MLARDLRIPHISTGDMFREHKAKGTEIGKKVQAIMDSGGLVTDDITNAMVKDRLSRPDVAGGFILDGYPRTRAQAEYLDRLLQSLGQKIDRVVSYEVAEEVVVDRISGRRSCPRCGAVYHVSQNPPRQAGKCDREGADLTLRDDDRPENVERRLQEYEVKTEPLRRYYHEHGLVAPVGGVGEPDEILAATKRLLGVSR